jgi:hypothetical protein
MFMTGGLGDKWTARLTKKRLRKLQKCLVSCGPARVSRTEQWLDSVRYAGQTSPKTLTNPGQVC